MENTGTKIDMLAVDYSTTGDEESLKELLGLLKGMIAAKARQYAATTRTCAEDWEAILTEAVWEAIRDGKIKDHDVTRTSVMQRIRTQWMYVFYDMVDRENAQRRQGDKNPVRLDSTPSPDMDAPLLENLADAHAGELYDVVALKESLRRFEADHPKEGQVINALAREVDKMKIALLMGFPDYNAGARDRVRRIRQMFRAYV